MLSHIRSLLSHKPKRTIAQSVFGEIQLEQGAKGPYWVNEAFGPSGIVVLIDTANGEPPSQAQAERFESILSSIGEIYASVSKELSVRHEQMRRKPVRDNWNETFALASVDIPLNGDVSLPWEITFECLTDKSGDLYTCHYENGAMVHVSVDT